MPSNSTSNEVYKRAAHTTQRPTSPHFVINTFRRVISPQPHVYMTSKEARLQLAKYAIDQSQIQSVRAAAKAYDAVRTTLRRRRKGIPSRADKQANCRKLTDIEEKVVGQYILDLDARGQPPNLKRVAAMANSILHARDQRPVGVQWPRNFVNRHPELKSRLNRRFDYQRAKGEDPVAIRAWFDRVRDVIAQHGIAQEDIYNVDETGFQMGAISSEIVIGSRETKGRHRQTQPGDREWVTTIHCVGAGGTVIPPFIVFAGASHLTTWYTEESHIPGASIGLSEKGWSNDELGFAWIQHFERNTPPSRGTHRLLILDGHGSHTTEQFENYCKEHAIVTLCMPPHSSHLLQPLDVGCFGPLKVAYGKEVGHVMSCGINHITKAEFLPLFRASFYASINAKNAAGGFRGAGIVPYDPDAVLSTLSVLPQTRSPSVEPIVPWSPKTPSNQRGFESQSTYISGRITAHQNSSPTPIVEAVNQLMKGVSQVTTQLALMSSENKRLRTSNEALSKRKARLKKRISTQTVLTQEQGLLLANGAIIGASGAPRSRNTPGEISGAPRVPRRCGRCREPGHRVETCLLPDPNSVEPTLELL